MIQLGMTDRRRFELALRTAARKDTEGTVKSLFFMEIHVSKSKKMAVPGLALALMIAVISSASAATPRRSEVGDGLVSGMRVGKTIDSSPRFGHSRGGDRFYGPRHCGKISCFAFAKHHRIYSGKPYGWNFVKPRR